MEQEPNPEKIIEKDKLLERLKANGFDHAETKELMIKWIKQQEEGVKTSHARIIFELNIADLYLAGGKIEDSFRSLEDALDQADQENDRKLQGQIVARLKEFRAKYPEIVKKLSTFPLLSEDDTKK